MGVYLTIDKYTDYSGLSRCRDEDAAEADVGIDHIPESLGGNPVESCRPFDEAGSDGQQRNKDIFRHAVPKKNGTMVAIIPAFSKGRFFVLSVAFPVDMWIIKRTFVPVCKTRL